MAALLTVGRGTSVVTENIFNNRFRYVDELNRMGAQISVDGRTAIIRGVSELTGARVSAPDLRAGAALVVAGLAARGETVIDGVEHITRGYDSLAERMASCGALISHTVDASEAASSDS
jgi:UDP-N-acetylglucosamine 1-carboxyvinyltransferase